MRSEYRSGAVREYCARFMFLFQSSNFNLTTRRHIFVYLNAGPGLITSQWAVTSIRRPTSYAAHESTRLSMMIKCCKCKLIAINDKIKGHLFRFLFNLFFARWVVSCDRRGPIKSQLMDLAALFDIHLSAHRCMAIGLVDWWMMTGPGAVSHTASSAITAACLRRPAQNSSSQHGVVCCKMPSLAEIKKL